MVKAIMFIEAQANMPNIVQRSLNRLVADLKSEGIEISDYEVSEEEKDTIEGADSYSAFVEIEVEAPLRNFLRLCMRVTPSSMEVLDAKKELDSKDALQILGDVCNVVGKFCQSAGVRLPMPPTNFGDETQDGPGLDEEEFDDLIDQGFINFKFVSKVAGDQDIVSRDILRVMNVFGSYVNKLKLQEDGEQTKGFVGLAAVEALIPNMETLFEVVLRFNPIAMSIEHPDVLNVSLVDLQNLAITLSAIMTDITTYITVKQNRLIPEE